MADADGSQPEFMEHDTDDYTPLSQTLNSHSSRGRGSGSNGDDRSGIVTEEDIDDVKMHELGTKVWLVKVPDFLAEKWRGLDVEDQEIGKLRIYDQPDKDGNNISMILPNDERNHDIPREYHLKVINNQVQNMYVFSELRKPDPALKPTSAKAHKAVPTALTGTVHHECTVSPVFNDEYQNIMRKRTLNADRPTKSVKLVNDIFIPAVHQQASFGDYSGAGTKTKRQKLEAKSTRMPREELLDMLFKMFADYEYWSFNGLTEKTNQPKAYLKEVASEIAALQRGGSYNNMYKLKPEYMNKGVTAKPGAAPTTAGGGGSDGPVGSSNASNKTSESADVVIDDDEDFFGEDDDFGNDS